MITKTSPNSNEILDLILGNRCTLYLHDRFLLLKNKRINNKKLGQVRTKTLPNNTVCYIYVT